MHFCAYIPEAFIGTNANIQKQQEKLSTSSLSSLPSHKLAKVQSMGEVQLDDYNLPTIDDKSFASRFKFFEYKSRTDIM